MLGGKYSLHAFCFAICAGSFFGAGLAWADITYSGNISPVNPTTWNATTTGNVGLISGDIAAITVNANGGNSTLTSDICNLGVSANSTGQVIVTDTGSSWTNNGTLYIGLSGTGDLTIANGGQVSNTYGYLGLNSGSIGNVTVTGNGSAWTNNGYLYVGSNGKGNLTISAGGMVSDTACFLGGNIISNSTGNATVTGNGSTWTNNGFLNIDSSGNLRVENGGVVTAQSLGASLGNFLNNSGNGTINTNGWIADANLVFDATHGLQQSFSFGTGGTLNLNVNSANGLGAGWYGTGTMLIKDGVTVASDNGFLGYAPGSTGTATITGIGSTWTNNYFYVGSAGTGTLTIANGGKVSSYAGYLGANLSSSRGNATITGNGSIWTIGIGDMYIGDYGNGTLTITNGGQVSNYNGYLGYNLGSTGTAMITGNGSTWTNNGALYVGYNGNGTLTIVNGGQLGGINPSVYLGYNSGSTGTVTITGNGSTFTYYNLSVGYSGTGTLTIANGGQVSNILHNSSSLGSAYGSRGNATVTGIGSKWTNSNWLEVGFYGTGNLTIANGGQVIALGLSINSLSSVNLRVSGNNQLVSGNVTTIGSIANNGTINLYANTFLSAGVYTPISELLSRSMTWSGSGTYNAFGGTWDNLAKTFAVPANTPLGAGVTGILGAGERLLISGNSQQVGASFGAGVAGSTFSANLATAGEINSLQALLSANETVLSAWDYTTNLSGNTVLLSYSLQTGDSNLRVWHYNGSLWSLYPASDLVFDSSGIASFTVNSFSGYAVTGIVPEPASLALLGLGAVLTLWRKCRKKS